MFLALSFFTFVFFGLGNLVLRLARLDQGLSAPEKIAFSFVLGMLVDFSFILLGIPFVGVGILSGLLACGGFYFWWKSGRFSLPRSYLIFVLVGAFVLFAKVLTEPIKEWDARTIWFFTAKVIYQAGGLVSDIQLQHPTLRWSHPDYPDFNEITWCPMDYPKFIPALAAQMTYLAGYFNDFIGKLSIFFSLFAGLLLVARYLERSFSFALLVLTLFCSEFALLWNGYVDGIVVLFACLTMWQLLQFMSERRAADFLGAVLSTAVLLSLKNEGSLLTISMWGFFLLREFWIRGARVKWTRWMQVSMGAMLIPSVLWLVRKSQLGLTSDFKFLSAATWDRAMSRVHDPVATHKILHTVLIEHKHTWKAVLLYVGVVGALYLVARLLRKDLPEFIGSFCLSLIPVVAAFVYMAGLILVYFSTPNQVVYHVDTSVDRVMMVFYALHLVAITYLIRSGPPFSRPQCVNQ